MPRLLALGTCNVDGHLEGLRAQGIAVDHLLWESYPHHTVPQVDQSAYDAVLASITLAHVLTEAHHSMYPGEIYGNQIAWPRILCDGRTQEYFDHCRALIGRHVSSLAALYDRVPLFVMSFIEPKHNYLGNLLPRYDLSNPKRFIERLNVELAKALDGHPNAYFFDMNEMLALVGSVRLQDDYVAHIGHASVLAVDSWDKERFQPSPQPTEIYASDEAMTDFAQVFARRILDNLAVLKSPLAIKAIIVDLDDTLWRGILADDDGRPVHEFTEGWPMGLAEALLIYKARGGMLAIASKNDHSFIEARWPRVHNGRLRLEDFASIKISCNPKSQSVREILSELNVLPGSVLFVDDNPREIEEVRQAFPEMHFLSSHHYDWRRTILMSPATQVASISAEAKLRTASVQARVKGIEAAASMGRDEWLASLDLQQSIFTIRDQSDARFERAFELVNKTNQFNTTGRRWSLAEMTDLLADGGELVCSALRDRLSDNGLIGVMIVQRDTIVQAVLSCRVFNMGVEYAAGRYACERILAKRPIAFAEMADTGRNKTCHDYFAKMGFVRNGEALWKTQSIPKGAPHLSVSIETPNANAANDRLSGQAGRLMPEVQARPKRRWFGQL